MKTSIKLFIPGSKPSSSFHCFSITQTEENVLFRKCRAAGMSIEDSHERMKKLCKFLRDEKKKLQKNKKLSESDINERFKKSFENLVMTLDGERE